jgi:hypothetical protein
MDNHVANDCVVTIKRNECAERSRLKSTIRVICHACEQAFPEKRAKMHYAVICTSRLVEILNEIIEIFQTYFYNNYLELL